MIKMSNQKLIFVNKGYVMTQHLLKMKNSNLRTKTTDREIKMTVKKP